MTVKQISVFLENKPSAMAKFTDVLSENKIDMRALSLAEAADFGIVRIIVDDVFGAMQVIKDAGYVCSATKVLAVAIPDEPGGLAKVIHYLGEAGINMEYMYAFTTRQKDVAYMIFRVDNNDKATKVLTEKGFSVLNQDDIF